MLIDSSSFIDTFNQDQLVPELHLDTQIQISKFEDSSALNTPTFDLEKTTILDDFFGDFESVAFPSLGDMSSPFMSLNPSPVTTPTTTNPTKTNPQTTVATGSFVVQPHLSPRADEDIPFYEEMPVAVKIENVDVGYEKSYSPASVSSSDMSQSMDTEYGDAEMDKNKKEVLDACHQLAIPTDPYKWTIEHVQRWARWTLDQYNLPITHVDEFMVDGNTICNLTPAEFQSMSPNVGEYLFAQLEFWKSVHIVTTADVRSISGSPSSVHSQDTTMAAGPSYPLTHSPQMPLTYTNLDQPTSSCSTSQQPIVIAPIATSAYDVPKCCIAPVMMSSTMTTSAPMEQYQGMFTAIKQEPLPSCSSSSMPSLPTIGTLRGMSPLSSRSSPALSQASTSAGPSHRVSAPLPKLTQTKHNIHLWQFLRELLLRPETYSNCIRWLDRSKGIFKIEDSVRVARLWGQRKNRPAMNYDKLSRSIRQYYKKGIIKKTDNSKRLVYQFCPPYRA